MATERLGVSSRAIIGSFYDTLETRFDMSWPAQLGMRFTSDQASEEYKWLGASPGLREWVGGRHPKSLRSNGITIENKTYESTLAISVDDIRRDKTQQINVRVQEQADRANQHWASLLSTIIKNGDGSTNGLCYDGQYFFDTDHSEGSSGTLNNAVTASEVATLNVTTAASPTADEMANAILGLVNYMYTYLDDQGEPLNENAKEFAVMVPTAGTFYASALQAVTKNNLYTGSGVRDNPLMTDLLKFTVIPNPRLDWTTEFAVFRTDGRAKPFILQEEEGVTVSLLGEGSEHEFVDNEWLFGVKAIRNVGYGMWQHAIKGTLS